MTTFIISWTAFAAGFMIGYLHRYKIDEPKHYVSMSMENTLLKADNRNLRSRLQGMHNERGIPHDPADWWKEGE